MEFLSFVKRFNADDYCQFLVCLTGLHCSSSSRLGLVSQQNTSLEIIEGSLPQAVCCSCCLLFLLPSQQRQNAVWKI